MEDTIIVGAGPAGLTAAIYLARFHLKVRVFDCGSSRAAMIPRTHNHAGYPGGIPGRELLARMQTQAAEFGVAVEHCRVTAIEPTDARFRVACDDREWQARTVLLATGVVNRRPKGIDDVLHDEALERGLLRYCPICDGYEVTDRRVGVIGTGKHGMKEALFLRTYTRDVTLIAPHAHDLDDACAARLEAAGIACVDGPCGGYAIDCERLRVETAAGPMAFDSVYPALGSDIRSDLAVAAGAAATDEGCLTVDDHMRTSVPGLFAAGDVVLGLDQISNAMGQAGIAATTIRNDIDAATPLRR